jgi:hypothetical protein
MYFTAIDRRFEHHVSGVGSSAFPAWGQFALLWQDGPQSVAETPSLSQLLIQQYLNQLQDLRKVSGFTRAMRAAAR